MLSSAWLVGVASVKNRYQKAASVRPNEKLIIDTHGPVVKSVHYGIYIHIYTYICVYM